MTLHKLWTVDILRRHMQTEAIPSIKDAALVSIRGKNALTVRSCSSNTINGLYDGYLTQILLHDVPLVQINSSGCPTCTSLLATGYGIDRAQCPELHEIQTKINAPFVSLDASIEALMPLLTLLASGLYLIADAQCYPTDGNGHFFWDTPNEPTPNPATAMVYLPDAEYAYVSGQPVYLYPTQDTDCYHSERVDDYIKQFQNTAEAPRAVGYCFSEWLSFLLDGHHKACAAASLKQPLDCILILPFSGYGYKTIEGKSVLDSLHFSEIKIPVQGIPDKYLPAVPTWKDDLSSFSFTAGTIHHRNWETRYTKSVNSYPSLFEYAYIVNAGIPIHAPVTEERIAACFAPMKDCISPEMLAVLLVLKYQNDLRWKQIAIQCAKNAAPGKLKERLYGMLAEIKEDAEIEQLFIDYLVDHRDKHDAILPIVNGYWNSSLE